MNAFFLHLAYEFRAGFRHKQLLLMNYLFPLGYYLLMGLILTGINSQFREDMIPAMILFSTLAATLLGIPLALTTAREKGILRSYKINGIPAISILTISIITCISHVLLMTAIITVSGPILFDALIPIQWFNFVLVFILSTVSYASMSALIGVVSSSSRVAILWSQLIFVTSILLGGLMIPNQVLPEEIGMVSILLPATHAMNAFRGLAMGHEVSFSPLVSSVVLFLGSLLAYFLAIYLFNWDHQNDTRQEHPLLGILAFVPYVISIFWMN